MVNTYVLVNPHIEGSLETKVKAKNSIEAGKLLYNNLSEHFSNNLPKFLFTIQKGSSGEGKFYNFKVKEKKVKNEINFSIEPFSIEGEKSALADFKKKLNNFKNKRTSEMKGGAPKKKGSKKASKKKSAPKKKGSKKASKKTDEDIFEDIDVDIDDSPKMKTELVKKYVPSSILPISYFRYDPFVYRLNSFFIPTFYSYLTPYVQVDIRSPL